MMRRWLLACLFSLVASAAGAQLIQGGGGGAGGTCSGLLGDVTGSCGANTVVNLTNVTNSSLANTGLAHNSITIAGQLTALGGATTNQGTGTKILTATGTYTSGHCLQVDASTGAAADSGAGCGGLSSLTVGTTVINSGTSGNVEYNNAGVLGEKGVSGTGNVCLVTNCALVTPNLGTPSAAVLTNATGLPISTGVSGLGTGVATALGLAVSGSGAVCLASGSACAAGSTPIIFTGSGTFSSNAVTITTTTPTGWLNTNNNMIQWTQNGTNTGTETLAVNGQTAEPVDIQGPPGCVAAPAGYIQSALHYAAAYDTTCVAFVLVTQPVSAITSLTANDTITATDWGAGCMHSFDASGLTETIPTISGLSTGGFCFLAANEFTATLAAGAQTIHYSGGVTTSNLTIPVGTTVLVTTNGSYIDVAGFPASGGGGTPCTTTALSVQYNNAGAFGCVSGVTSNGTALTAASSDVLIKGSSTGTNAIAAANASATNYTDTIPPLTGDFGILTGTLNSGNCVQLSGGAGGMVDSGSANCGGTPPCVTTASSLQYDNAGAFGCVSGATSNGTTLTMASSDLLIKGSSTGTNAMATANASATNYTDTWPALTGDVGILTGTLTSGDCVQLSGTAGGMVDSGSTNCGGGGTDAWFSHAECLGDNTPETTYCAINGALQAKVTGLGNAQEQSANTFTITGFSVTAGSAPSPGSYAFTLMQNSTATSMTCTLTTTTTCSGSGTISVVPADLLAIREVTTNSPSLTTIAIGFTGHF